MTQGQYHEEDYLPLSGIQHFAFCKRQFALIHVERMWTENVLTFEGRAMHDRADDPFYFESRGTLLITRSAPLSSARLGLYGVADVVEFRLCSDGGIMLDGREGLWRPFPVEYKRGQPKSNDCDVVQPGSAGYVFGRDASDTCSARCPVLRKDAETAGSAH